MDNKALGSVPSAMRREERGRWGDRRGGETQDQASFHVSVSALCNLSFLKLTLSVTSSSLDLRALLYCFIPLAQNSVLEEESFIRYIVQTCRWKREWE